MGTKKVNVKGLFLMQFVLLTMHSYSQSFFTKKLQWTPIDSIEKLIFQDTTQIIEWGKRNGTIVSVSSKKYYIKNNDIFIMMIDNCSGIYCPSIYIFYLRNKLWNLTTSTFAKLNEQIEVEVDNGNESFVFKTNTAEIGSLSFEKLGVTNKK